MSVKAITWVFDHSESELGSRLVLLSIADHAKDDGTGSWPSVNTIAKQSRLSERETRYCLRKLEKSGELQTQIGCGPYGTNMYSLPKMGGVKVTPGAKSAPGGAILCREGGNLRQLGGQSTAPNPSLTVHKDKEGNFYLLGPEGIRTVIGPVEAKQYGYS